MGVKGKNSKKAGRNSGKLPFREAKATMWALKVGGNPALGGRVSSQREYEDLARRKLLPAGLPETAKNMRRWFGKEAWTNFPDFCGYERSGLNVWRKDEGKGKGKGKVYKG